MYNKYGVTLGKAESLIGQNREEGLSNFYSDRVTLKQFLHLPMKKVADYLATFNEVLDESFSNGGTMTELFKHCAIIEVEFNTLHRRVMENYRLYALRDDRVSLKKSQEVNGKKLIKLIFTDPLQDPWPSGALGGGLLQRTKCPELQITPDQVHLNLCEHPK